MSCELHLKDKQSSTAVPFRRWTKADQTSSTFHLMLWIEFLWGSTHTRMFSCSFSSTSFCCLEFHVRKQRIVPLKLNWGNKTNKWTFYPLCNISLVYLCWSDTVSFWYVIWCFVLKESLWWSYTDLSWKSRLSLRGWCEKGKEVVADGEQRLFLRSKCGFLSLFTWDS